MTELEAEEEAPTDEGVALVLVVANEWRFTTHQASENHGKGNNKTNATDPQAHRVARLFVAGEFPDKNLTVTEADLDGLITRFHATGARRPVQIEHIVSPLDPLGEVVGLHRCGAELFGLLVFSAGVEAHLQKRGVENVSVALVRENDVNGDTGGFSLKEVSLVLKGRIPSATLFDETALHTSAGDSGANRVRVQEKGNESTSDKMARFRALGKLTPATEPLAAILLSAHGPLKGGETAPLTFGASGGQADFADVFAQFLDALPPVCSRFPLASPNRGKTSSRPTVGKAASDMAARFGVSPHELAARLS